MNDRNEVIGVSTAGLAPDKASNVFFAIRGATVQSFLGKHRIPFSIGEKVKTPMEIPDMVDLAVEIHHPFFDRRCYPRDKIE